MKFEVKESTKMFLSCVIRNQLKEGGLDDLIALMKDITKKPEEQNEIKDWIEQGNMELFEQEWYEELKTNV